MCGLIGIIGDRIPNKGANFMAQGLVVDTVRGAHSTGLLSVLKDQGAEWYKDSVDGYSFVTQKTTEDLLKENFNRRAYLGHNRAATIGAVDRKNAHPFREGNIILMHNGTLRDIKNLPEHHKFDVDSHAIAYSINKIGAEETIKKLRGAFALVWYDLGTRKINIVRNEQRPLYIGKVEETSHYVSDNIWLYGSEVGMLKWLSNRNGMEVKNWASLKPGVLVSFDMEGKTDPVYKKVEYIKPPKIPDNWKEPWKGHKKNKNYDPPSNQETLFHFTKGKLWKNQKVTFWPEQFKYYTEAVSSRGRIVGYMSQDPFEMVVVHGVLAEDHKIKKEKIGGNIWYTLPEGLYEASALSVGKTTKGEKHIILKNDVTLKEEYNKKSKGEKKKEKEGKKVVSINEARGEPDEEKKHTASRADCEGPRGILISEKEWSKLTENGCCCCQRNFFKEDINKIYWIDTKSPVCAKCADDNDMSMCMS